jgi:D-alanyl-D-alanine carboxypeptidase/D-alanyl-D-alanine-endopeptidase (penicillin-binding protein 4)
VALALLALTTATASAVTVGPAALSAQLTRVMRSAGPFSGAYVYDLSSGRTLFSERADEQRPPASVEKLYTSTTALTLLGADARLETDVLGAGSLGPDGVWHGDLFLHGGGDPTFGSADFIARAYGVGEGASVGQLGLSLRAAGLRRVDGRILGDESMFDALRGGPRTGFRFDPDLTGVLSALAFDRGQSGGQQGLHAPAAYAALQLAGTLRHLGVTVTGASGAGVAPPAATTVLARVQSPPLSTLLDLQNTASDNFFAEMLVKVLGARFGGAGTTTAGAAVVRRTIAPLGVRARVVDGSGLSRADATSPRQVVTLLTKVFAQPLGAVLRSSLAVAGQTGTLRLRMRATAAAGRCQGKTGTLDGVSNLAGWCDAAGGHTLAFAFEMDGISDYAAHLLQDNMTITVARYAGG